METDGRGFGFLEPFATKYHGEVRLKESSAAHPCIWLFAQKPYGSAEPPDLHLTYEDAIALHEKLGEMIAYTKGRWEHL